MVIYRRIGQTPVLPEGESMQPVRKMRKFSAVFAGIFGVMTLVVGGSALTGTVDFGTPVPFVLIFNFASGFGFVAVGWGLWAGRNFARLLTLVMFGASLIVALGLVWWISQGGAYMPRTLWALSARTLVWGGLVLVARRVVAKR